MPRDTTVQGSTLQNTILNFTFPSKSEALQFGIVTTVYTAILLLYMNEEYEQYELYTKSQT